MRYYPFLVSLDRCIKSWNTFDGLSNKVCISNKTEDLNLRVFNMVTEINESKTLTKYGLCKCKLNLMMENVIPMKSGRTINVECKNRKEHHVCKKAYIWNLATSSCKDDKYLGNFFDDSVKNCVEMIDRTKAIKQILMKTKVTCKTKNFHVSLHFH